MTDSRSTVPGTIVGFKYEMLDIAGEGGMATVWRATMKGAAGFERQVAIKRLKPQFRAIQNYIDMFVEEARVGSELAHPNIVQVFDLCRDSHQTFYLVMEWVEGIDLFHYNQAFVRAKELTPWVQLASVGEGILRGLSAAHERIGPNGEPAPIIHRDVSPQNILLASNGTVKLSDFGLAWARDRMTRFTAPGTVKGKLSYMAPEILGGKQPDARSDLYSMGVSLWESIAGARLFAGSDDLKVLTAICDGDVQPLASIRSDVPKGLVDVVHRALEKNPDDRYETAREMANALAEVVRVEASVDSNRLIADSIAWARSQNQQAATTPVTEAAEVLEPTWSMIIEELPNDEFAAAPVMPPPPPGSSKE